MRHHLTGGPADCQWMNGFWIPGDCKPENAGVIINSVYYQDEYKIGLRPIKHGDEFVVDIGANIGCFSRRWHNRNPEAQIVCVEVCPELIPSLLANVSEFASVLQGACHYGDEKLYLLNATIPESPTIGGSRVVGIEEFEAEKSVHYRHDDAICQTHTLESIMDRYKRPGIDVLKLDCEGSEISILENCDLSRVGTIFVESHNHQRWMRLMNQKFMNPNYSIGHMSMGGTGNNFSIWHLVNRSYHKLD